MTAKPIAFRPDYRLKTILRLPGGITIAEALARADARLESIKPSYMLVLDFSIEELAAAMETAQEIPSLSAACEIADLAGMFRVYELAAAAESLCELLAGEAEESERSRQAPGGDRRDEFLDSVRVHLDALRTLRRPELSDDPVARQAVVEGLRLVTGKRLTRLAGPGL